MLVTGSTGNVGSAVVRALEAQGAPIRLTSRPDQCPPDTDHEVVDFDFTTESTWPEAFAGVRSMFLVRPPAIGNDRRDLLPPSKPPSRPGVEHVAFLSLQGAEKNRVVPHATIEKWLRRSGLDWTFVRASFFHQNISTTHLTDVRDRDEIFVPADRGATAFVDAEDVGAVAAAALLDRDDHAGKAWTVTGPRALTYDEVAAILTLELGRPITYSHPGLLAYLRHASSTLGMPLGMVMVTAAIYTTARLGMAGGLTTEVKQILGREPIDFAEFAHREREVWNPTNDPAATST